MQIESDRVVGLLSFTAETDEEGEVLKAINSTIKFGRVLPYEGRGGVNHPNVPLDQHMWLRFSYDVGGKKFELLATTEESEKIVRQMRDALYYGGGGLIFVGYYIRNGKHFAQFAIGACRVCHKPVISRVECEWRYCDTCAEKCEHRYERGAVHGDGVDLGVGEFCGNCGRAKPKVEGEQEKPLYDHHIAAEQELGVRVFYQNLPGITPQMIKGLKEGTLKKVLVVEDNQEWSSLIRRGLGDKVLVVQAFTMEEAEAVFERHPDLAVILMDACVPGDKPNTMGLVRKMRKTFKGPIVAISNYDKYREELMRAGCDYEAEKDDVAKKVLELVGAA